MLISADKHVPKLEVRMIGADFASPKTRMFCQITLILPLFLILQTLNS